NVKPLVYEVSITADSKVTPGLVTALSTVKKLLSQGRGNRHNSRATTSVGISPSWRRPRVPASSAEVGPLCGHDLRCGRYSGDERRRRAGVARSVYLAASADARRFRSHMADRMVGLLPAICSASSFLFLWA